MDTYKLPTRPASYPPRRASLGEESLDGLYGYQGEETIRLEHRPTNFRPHRHGLSLGNDRHIPSPRKIYEPQKETRVFGDANCRCFKSPEGLGRNLVVCIDGTANQVGDSKTHVAELYSRLKKDRSQLTYYSSGIGTFPRGSSFSGQVKQGILNGWDMAVAWNLKKNVLHAYRWLSDNYQPGDRIFLFGFSRGAYQVRIISGMISRVGLLPKGNIDQIEFAYGLYMEGMTEARSWLSVVPFWRKRDLTKRLARIRKIEQRTRNFKETLSHEHATVHLVGIWDTVSSVGLTGEQSFPDTVDGTINFCFCRHVLSLDERRGKFLPQYINGGAGPAYSRAAKRTVYWEDRLIDPDRNRVKEVWFVGAHSDVGGGNSKGDSNNPSLRWMLYESLKHGLHLKLSVQGWKPPEHKPSLKGFWRLLEIYPFRRLTYRHPDPDETKRWPPNYSRGRRMQNGQLIHESVFEYMKEHAEYMPAARGPRDGFDRELKWKDVERLATALEKDADLPALHVLSSLRDAAHESSGITKNHLQALEHLVSEDRRGPQSIIDAAADGSISLLFDALGHIMDQFSGSKPDDHLHAVINAIAAALALFPSVPHNAPRPSVPRTTLRRWLRFASDADQERIMEVFGPLICRGHHGGITSVAYSADGKLIVSGSWDKSVRLWDAKTGLPVGPPLQGHTQHVNTVAFSPDGQLVASGSDDRTIRIWDVTMRRAAVAPLTGHSDSVSSVAFSQDGKEVVSCSRDNTVRTWNVDTSRAVRTLVRGIPDSCARMVSFSSDWKRMVTSGTEGDKAIRVWEFRGDRVTTLPSRIREGHTDWVKSVAFSPDGKRIVSGSRDRTIVIWDADSESDKPVLGPLYGHQDDVNPVAVSHDGKYIASGSDDMTIRLWDAKTGKVASEPLQGHTAGVWSVAFSPDGQQVVSGSYDSTLIIWNVSDLRQEEMSKLRRRSW